MPKMGLEKLKLCTFWSASIWVFAVLSFLGNMAQCQVYNPANLPFLTSLENGRLSNLTNVISKNIKDHAGFCIKDQEAEWNKAFNFSSNLDFLDSCMQETQGTMERRLCTEAEAKFYFDTYFNSSNANALRPNKNCNLTSWVSGCEPGWACLSGYNELVNNNNSIVIPSRTSDCQPCCAGFFCPRGLTCMLPCPLGSHCPKATQDNQTGLCEPYSYQLPPGHPNHTCGGANIWVDIRNNSEIFCPAGSYCPTTVQKELCRNGHYCRTGSTSQKPCIKLTSCNSNTATQDLQVYGIFLLVATVTLLLIIYNCSDQVLTTRERRLAKTREAAAISARETAKARQRWKAAKNAAKKHARGLQTHISQRFSFKKAAKHPEELKILDKTRFETDEHLYAPVHMSTSSESLSSSAPSRGQPIELSNPMRVIHEIEDEPGNYDGFDVGSHDRKSKGQTTKGQRPHTHSQIFKYAYAQIEKEKAQQQDNENLTFSGVVSMATDHEMKKRHLIEISFKDLTLTLKGKEKHLLRCVTGTMKPGRITAVMGPSGAGKTTFISALAGKAMGCKKTGLILINGKNESILSYRKIIGYVPQDDIVHGNLTVEENLWFNAKCRLPAHLPKPDKVLVLERVIESLGLQTVRDSLVGTVEKRGISGGQRKRVNVGLEMVMEPSLLILDEPTSGLDSASSLQLLRALRREALEGVNICMVLHQPSYSLFQMFDDLVLLAKGGLTVYHGSAKKAEQYFAGLGIHVPDHVNPPDHFIDVLEGIVKPSQSSDVNYLELPVRWMLHNGYQVPPDLQQTAARIAMSSASPAPTNGTSPRAGIEEKSFAGELWQDVMSKVEIYRDSIRHNFLKSKDLSRRRTPGVLWQYRYFLGRLCKQRMRESKEQAIDYLILLLAGLCLGTIAKTDEVNFGAAGYTYTIIAVSLLCQIAALRSFSLDKLQYWRESASGMSSLAYFLAKDTVDHFNTVIKPVVYLSMYFFITNPRSTFTENYTVLLCLVYCVTGMGYAFAIFFQPGPAQLWSALVPVVLTLVASQTQDSEVMKKISNLCYPKWALEAFVIANAERYYGVWLITRCATLKKTGYSLDEWALCIVILILTGVICRSIAYLVMITSKKK